MPCSNFCFLLLQFYKFIYFIFFILLSKVIKSKDFLKKNYIKIVFSIIIFLFLSIPHLIIYYFSEKDFSTMIGVINLTYDYKLNLLLHFITIFLFSGLLC